MTRPVLQSIQVGLPRKMGLEGATDPMDRPWTSGFQKSPVPGPVRVGSTNVEGDGQADLEHHGGPDKAVLAYSADHYAQWRQVLQKPNLPFGAFGENFTIAGLNETTVCVGDIWQLGDVRLQVSQPRQPCWKLARRWRIKTLALQVQESGRTGWYFRVLTEGMITPGLGFHLQDRPYPDWTIERSNRIMHFEKDDLRAAAELAALAPLATSWKSTLTKRVEKNANPDPSKRLIGPNDHG
ncbi:MOSC domain-containing protein [Schlesneria sp. T3-172]|uniref:MOSC domain-containing protein n=1 Tax=Schlesneria sphaerica TaxID=3373610 RepID=UPI0037C588FE